jgi:hypothetical protein
VVPADKPYITLSGRKGTETVITWNEAWFNQQSPTVSILASDFVGRYLTIQVQENNIFPLGNALFFVITHLFLFRAQPSPSVGIIFLLFHRYNA